MSNKQSRHTPSPAPSSPSPSNANHATSKLPKFLQKPGNRDRSKSVTDPSASPSTSSLASGSSASTSPELIHSSIPISKPRKTSKFLGLKDKDKEEKVRKSSEAPLPPPPVTDNSTQQPNNGNISVDMDEPPVIVEPVAIPRSRTRSERPVNSAPDSHLHHVPTLYSSTSSTSRIGDLPTRLSGWFSHTFSSSSTDLSLPTLLAQQASPKGKGPSALITAAKNGKGHLDKAMRYLLDSDAMPDKCTDPIWLLGVQHPGYEPSNQALPNVVSSYSANNLSTSQRRGSAGSPPSFRSSTSSIASSADLSLSQSSKHPNPAANWPPVFYIDFTSRIWLTYRSQFPTPIRDTRLADLCGDSWEGAVGSPTTVKTRPWNWGGEKTWSSDSGWGCMLRTGQSLLANALIHMHLGRDWRRPPYPVQTADYATYVQILTWFLDTPVPEAPFSVHRMALAGKELGTDVGQWFGPSVAAGAIRTLVHAYQDCGLAVSVATDSTLYQTQVYAASHGDTSGHSPRRRHTASWGDRPVLLLLGIRLGIEGVNPIYYDTIKLLYTFPQSVGIAGGRPSSSYYFVGSQADNLFYLDPHNPRPAIPLRPTPPPAPTPREQRESTPESDRESTKPKHQRASPNPHSKHHRAPTSPSSTRTGSSNFSYHAPVSPSPLQQQFSSSSADSSSGGYAHSSSRSPPPSYQQHSGRWRSASASQPGSPGMSSSEMDHRELGIFGAAGVEGEGNGMGLDPLQQHFCKAYSAAELKTFHCDRVRKMPMSGLDPSMLIGFLCRDEADWWDFRRRVGDLPRTIFSVQDEPPTWPSDSDDNMGLESISEPDDMDLDDEEGEEVEIEGDGEQFFDTRSGSASTSSASAASNNDRRSRAKSEEVDTEEDPVDPVTPGPNSKFDIIDPPLRQRGRKGGDDDEEEDDDEDKELDFRAEDGDGFEDDDIEDDWVDPSVPSPTPTAPPPPPAQKPPPVPMKDHPPSPPSSTNVPLLAKGKSSSSKNGTSSSGKAKKSRKQIPVPVPSVKLPVPHQHLQQQEQQEHYPFPVTPAEDPALSPQDRGKGASGKRMHTARARDGGRTQSGGVKGILTDD
ncbi:peptidase family C54-domain-containing protein [Crassisporium funariophilum]|nr:peptidase family C54-domain-containing protein [Crassisporium funariophilum]